MRPLVLDGSGSAGVSPAGSRSRRCQIQTVRAELGELAAERLHRDVGRGAAQFELEQDISVDFHPSQHRLLETGDRIQHPVDGGGLVGVFGACIESEDRQRRAEQCHPGD